MPIAIKSVKTILLSTFKILRSYVLFDRCDGQTWRTDVTDRRGGSTWRTDRLDGQTWRTDVMDSVMDRRDRQTWQTDVTDGRKTDMMDRHDRWADAAMNLNRPACQTTNHSKKKLFDMLRKSTFCSHFYLYKKVQTFFIVRTFYNICERIIRHCSCSCSHLFEWKP